jgi:hypothetical protein
MSYTAKRHKVTMHDMHCLLLTNGFELQNRPTVSNFRGYEMENVTICDLEQAVVEPLTVAMGSDLILYVTLDKRRLVIEVVGQQQKTGEAA